MINENEITSVSLAEIIARLWNSRGYIIAVTILALLLGLAIASFSGFSSAKSISYYITLTNIENSKYPNGLTFSPGDITSAAVLENVRKRLGLSADVKLESNIVAMFDNPKGASIEENYRSQLSARGLSQTEVQVINAAFTEQLNSTIMSSVRIQVDYVSIGVDSDQGAEIARQLPISWADIYTKQFRTLLNPQMSALIPVVQVDDFKTAVGILSVNSKLGDIQRGLSAVLADNRLSSTQNSKGLTAEDLQHQLSLYKEIYFTPLFAINLGTDSIVSNIYLKDQQLKIEQLRQQIGGLDDAIDMLQVQQTGGENSNSKIPSNSTQQSTVQMDTGALSQIVSLAEKASNAEFLRELISKRQENIKQISDITRSISIIHTTSEVQVNDQEFIRSAYNDFIDLSSSYNQLFASARLIAQDRSGALYLPLTSPTLSGKLIDTRYLFLTIALTLMGLISSLAYAVFIRSASRQKSDV